ncbi:hypothetical protein [Pyrobaculum neutrophilum]|uniref:Uncharacterized protein n=1 Tax=Pyrobaculum neutrophilum (strain DSM 2338 / JCM 9278 / NBRC 100436 / V24Sta) TaxID=444157 RepID=B1Y972_PYRNV|nr:hypothetical protein [Pyrobaculum neutrophilum]ACB40301.1 conserved hypothetical protein [Pyrobaculum neutrophilum V24Sta]
MDEAEYISAQVVRYIERKLGDAVKNVTVFVSFAEEGVEVEVDIEASVLVDDAYLQRIADEAAELGICIADLIKERGWPLDSKEAGRCWKN